MRKLLVPLLLLLAAWPARAEICGFKINSFTAVDLRDGGDLEERFDTTATDQTTCSSGGLVTSSDATEHQVNYKDCLRYLGIQEGQSLAEGEAEGAEAAEVVESAEAVEVVEEVLEEVLEETLTETSGQDAGEEAAAQDATTETRSAGGALTDLPPKIEVDFEVDDSLLTGTWWYSVRTGSCTENVQVDEAATDQCWYLREKSELTSFSSITLQILMTDLLGTECKKGTTDQAKLYFVIQSDEDEADRAAQTVTIDLDYTPPKAVTDLTVEPGEKALSVGWNDDANTDSTTTEYKVYWANHELNDDNLGGEEVDSHGGLTTKAYRITGLELGALYYVGVVAVDDFDNESLLSEIKSGTPVLVTDGFEYYKESGGADKGGFCFVATATYGGVLHPAVGVLREFRDRFLMTSLPGRLLVHTYYHYSPPLAEAVRHSEALRVASQVVLAPLVGLAWCVTRLGAPLALLLLFALPAVPVLVRRARRILP